MSLGNGLIKTTLFVLLLAVLGLAVKVYNMEQDLNELVYEHYTYRILVMVGTNPKQAVKMSARRIRPSKYELFMTELLEGK